MGARPHTTFAISTVGEKLEQKESYIFRTTIVYTYLPTITVLQLFGAPYKTGWIADGQLKCLSVDVDFKFRIRIANALLQ